MITIITTRAVRRQLRAYGITPTAVTEAVTKAYRGVKVPDLGDGVLKLDIARGNRGPRHSCRGIFIKHTSDCFLFVDLFAKSEKDNLTKGELEGHKALASLVIPLTSAVLLERAEANDWSITHHEP